MNEDPVEWLGQHCGAGVHLREEGYALRTDDAVPAWERKAAIWTKEFIDGVMSWSPQDVTDIEPLNRIPVEPVKPESPWYDPSAVELGMTATGEGRPGNTSFNRFSALVDRAYLILERWQAAPPKQHGKPGRPPKDKPLSERAKGWTSEMRYRPDRKKAKEIAAREGVAFQTVEREGRRVRTERRGNAGNRSNFPRR